MNSDLEKELLELMMKIRKAREMLQEVAVDTKFSGRQLALLSDIHWYALQLSNETLTVQWRKYKADALQKLTEEEKNALNVLGVN